MDIRRRFLSKKRSGGSSGGDSSGTYTLNLNSQWEKTTAVANPDSSLYDGVYRSKSNYNVHDTAAIMYIDISGLTSFKLYIRSYAESSFDYVMVSQLDQTINNSTSYSSTSLVKAHTRGNQQSGTALSSYTPVEFTGIDGGSHRITVVYRKDGSANSGDDRGYVLIPKSQGSGGDSGGGDVDIDTTYSIMYTSSNGNVVIPKSTNMFGANITSNTYVNGQGVITFDGVVTSIGYQAFSQRTSLTSITIPDSVTEIGYYAFKGCTSLTSVTIGNSVTSIGDEAFMSCGSLTRVNISDLLDWCKISFRDGYANPLSNGAKLYINSVEPTEITIPDNVTSIGDYAFYCCTSLTSVTIGNSVTEIGYAAFNNCTSLTSVTIGDSVTSIGDNAFYYCDSLTSVTIGNGVTSIGDYAFWGSWNLERVDIPSVEMWASIDLYSNVSSPCRVGGKLYCNGKLLQEVILPSSLSQIKNYTFAHCDHITSVVLPESITTIGKGAFRDCTSLYSINIPNSVTSIGKEAFYNCDLLTNITIPEGVTKIEESTFNLCTSLSSITIPDSVVSIGYRAFYTCVSLTSVYCKPTTPPAGDSDMFNGNASGRIIYVPTASVDAYKAASGWSNYADAIVGYDFEDEGDDGDSGLTFPITLVEGDNGQLGIDLFNYLSKKYSAGDLFTEELYFRGTSYSNFDGRILQIISEYPEWLVLHLQNGLNVANISLDSNGIVTLTIYG